METTEAFTPVDGEAQLKNRNQKNLLCGKILLIDSYEISLCFGVFKVLVLMDVYSKKFTLVLTHGDIKASELYCRIHSSCITSELFQSLTCDCKLQLDDALKFLS